MVASPAQAQEAPPPATGAASTITTDGSEFVALTPSRLLDTRVGQTTIDGVSAGSGALTGGQTITVRMTGRGGLPATGVGAVAINLTVTGPTGSGYVTAWPSGSPRPAASSINFTRGQTIANSLPVKVGNDGTISLFASNGTQLVLDLQGWTAKGTGTSSITVPVSTELYAGSDVREVVPTETGTEFVLDASQRPPVVGGHVAVGALGAAEQGVIGRVDAVTKLPDGSSKVRATTSSLDEVFTKVDVKLDENVQPLPQDGITPTASGAAALLAVPASAWNCRETGTGASRGSAELFTPNGLASPLDIELQRLKTVHVLDLGGPSRDPYFLLQLSGEAVARVGVEVKTGFSCELTPTWRRNHRLRFHVASIGPVPVSINLEPTLRFEVGAKARVGFEQRHYFSYTFERRGSAVPSFRRGGSSDAPTFSADASVSASLFLGGDLSVMFGGGRGSANAQAGIYGAFGPRVAIAAEASQPGCVSVYGEFTAEFGLRLELWAKRWDYQVANLSSTRQRVFGPYCIPSTGAGGATPVPDSGAPRGDGTAGGGVAGGTGSILLSQGPTAPDGFRYAVTLRGWPGSASVTLTCRDSVDSGGFYTFTLQTNAAGEAFTNQQCYSADGPDHWLTGGGTESNHVIWGPGSSPGGLGPTPPPAAPKIVMSQGGAAASGFWYATTLSGFPAGSQVALTCRDSADPGGFWNQTFTVDGNGNASDSTLCYSGDGPDHWVTGGGIESNHVAWGPGSDSPVTPTPPPAVARITLARGGAAQFGYWYSTSLSGFPAGSQVTVTCRDSADPGGFYNQTFTVDGSGNAGDSTLCYSGDGPDHWVTGGGVESNHVGW